MSSASPVTLHPDGCRGDSDRVSLIEVSSRPLAGYEQLRKLKIELRIDVCTLILAHDIGVTAFLVQKSVFFVSLGIDNINRAVEPVEFLTRLPLEDHVGVNEIVKFSGRRQVSAPER